MSGKRSHHEGGDEQNVDRVEARHQVLPRELASEEEQGKVGSDDRDGKDRSVHDRESGPGQQVVRKVVTRQTTEHPEDQRQESEDPVEFTRLTEGTRKEHAHQVGEHGGDKDQRGPVVGLPNQEAAPDIEGDAHRRIERLRHHLTAER